MSLRCCKEDAHGQNAEVVENDGLLEAPVSLAAVERLLQVHHERFFGRLESRLNALHEQLVGSVPFPAPQERASSAEPRFRTDVGTRSSFDLCKQVTDRGGPSEHDQIRAEIASCGDLEEIENLNQALATQVGQAMKNEGIVGFEETTKSYAARLVESPCFESFFALAIISNAVFIGVQADLEAEGGEQYTVDTGTKIVGICYTVLFTVELLMKICLLGVAAFFSSDQWHWNTLDSIIVVASWVDLVIEEVLFGLEGNTSTSQIRILRIVRITRLIRIVRVTRIVRFIRALRTLVHQIMSTLKSLVWGILLLLLVIYLFAIFFTQSVSGHFSYGETSSAPDEKILRDYWSTVPRSMFTLYKAITNGISWDEVVLPLADIGQLAVIMFVSYISFTQLAVLNVLTGAFCQNAIDSAMHDQELATQAIIADKKRYVKQIEAIFKNMDLDNSGSVTILEFQEHLDDEKVRAYFDALELDTSDVWTLFKLMDQDSGQLLDMDEFVTGCLRLKGYARGIDLARLNYEFKWLTKRLGKFMRRMEERLSTGAALAPTESLYRGCSGLGDRAVGPDEVASPPPAAGAAEPCSN